MGVQQQVFSLDEAYARAQRGNLVYAEIVARKYLEQDPTNIAALRLLGLVALQAGLIDQALAIFRRGHAAWPDAGLDAFIARIEGMLPAWRQRHARRAAEQRYLLIKAWGYGFGSDMISLMGSLLLAELSGRTPIVHWGPNSLYSDGGESNSFRYYFEPLSRLTIDNLRPVAARGAFPAKWSDANLAAEDVNKFEGPDSRRAGLYFLERDENLAVFDYFCWIVDLVGWIPEDHPYHDLSVPEIYRTLWRKYLRPTARVTERIERFVAAHWPKGRVLAVHVRDGDHRYEQGDLLEVNAQYFALIDRMLAEQPASIYLMTDTSTVADDYKARYGDRVFMTDAQRTQDDTGIHYSKSADRVQLGIDILSDVLLATRADAFIGNGRSNPSCMVWHIKDWAPGAAHLIVPSFYAQQTFYLHDF